MKADAFPGNLDGVAVDDAGGTGYVLGMGGEHQQEHCQDCRSYHHDADPSPSLRDQEGVSPSWTILKR